MFPANRADPERENAFATAYPIPDVSSVRQAKRSRYVLDIPIESRPRTSWRTFYHAETGTLKVSAVFSELGREVRISSLGLLEVQSAFAMKVRTGVIDRQLAGQQGMVTIT